MAKPEHPQTPKPTPPPRLPEPTALHTAAQLAQRLQVSLRTVWGWVKEGMPCERFSAALVRFEVARCRAWLTARHAEQETEKKDLAQRTNGLHPTSAALH